MLNEDEEAIQFAEDDAADLLPDLEGSTCRVRGLIATSRTGHRRRRGRTRGRARDVAHRVAEPTEARRRTDARSQRLRRDSDQPGFAGADQAVVDGEVTKPETINYRTLKPENGRPVLRAHLRPDQGLGVLLRQVQADPLQGHRLRQVRRRGDRARRFAASGWATSSSPRRSATSGSSRARRAGSGCCSTSRRATWSGCSTSPVHRHRGRRGRAEARPARRSRKRSRDAAARPAEALDELEDELRADARPAPSDELTERAEPDQVERSRLQRAARTEEIAAAAEATAGRDGRAQEPAPPRTIAFAPTGEVDRARRREAVATRPPRACARSSARSTEQVEAELQQREADEAPRGRRRRSTTCGPAGRARSPRARAAPGAGAGPKDELRKLRDELENAQAAADAHETEYRELTSAYGAGAKGGRVFKAGHGRRGGPRDRQPDRPRRAGSRAPRRDPHAAPASDARRRPSACASSRRSARAATGPSG